MSSKKFSLLRKTARHRREKTCAEAAARAFCAESHNKPASTLHKFPCRNRPTAMTQRSATKARATARLLRIS
ncbi:MAG: hypothetical protein LUD39_04890 [Opitutae bacterium]|nr:hypothetical protein [Opitutae bacterium]